MTTTRGKLKKEVAAMSEFTLSVETLEERIAPTLVVGVGAGVGVGVGAGVGVGTGGDGGCDCEEEDSCD